MSEVYPTDYKLCLKCQTAGGNLVAKPEKASYLKFLQSADRWAKCKNPEYVKIQKRLEHTTQSELCRNERRYLAFGLLQRNCK